MKIPEKTAIEILKKSGAFNDEKITELTEQAKTENTELYELIVKQNVLSESELIKAYSDEIGVPYTEINVKELNKEILKQIPEHIAKLYNMVIFDGPLEDVDEPKSIAMEDPDDLQALDVLHKLFGQKIKVFIATHFNILSALDQYRGNIGSEISKIVTDSEEQDESDEEISEEDIAEDSPIAQTVNLVIEYAVKSGASDIHIEPRDKQVLIRYRVDGVLKEANRLPKRTLNALVSRIKILSNLKLTSDEHLKTDDLKLP
jgi:type IV pilus assembly protein PilB